MRPRSRIATASHTRSTSARMWVEKNTVVRPRSDATISSTSRRPMGSSALVGSSSMSRLGALISACAMPSRCFIPREKPPTRVRDRGKPSHLEQCGGARVERRAVEPEEPSRELEVLARRHPRIEAWHIGEEADLRADRVVCARDIMAEDVSRTRGRTRESRKDSQRRGLSSAVTSEEAEHHARSDDEIGVVEGDRVAEALGQAAKLDRRRVRRALSVHRADRTAHRRPAEPPRHPPCSRRNPRCRASAPGAPRRGNRSLPADCRGQ